MLIGIYVVRVKCCLQVALNDGEPVEHGQRIVGDLMDKLEIKDSDLYNDSYIEYLLARQTFPDCST
jgi:hypothetical protein